MIAPALGIVLALPSAATISARTDSRIDGFSTMLTAPAPVFRTSDGVAWPEMEGMGLSLAEGDLVRPCLTFFVPLPGDVEPVLEYTVLSRARAGAPPRSRPAVTPVLSGEGLSTVETYPENPTAPHPPVIEMDVVRALGARLARVRFRPFDGGGFDDYASSVSISLTWPARPGAVALEDSPLELICPEGVLWWPPGGRPTGRGIFWGAPWARILVSQTGCVALTCEDLEEAGCPVGGMPSASLRLFTGPGVQFDIDDPADSHEPAEAAILVLDGGDGVFEGTDSLIFVGRALGRYEAGDPGGMPGSGAVRTAHRYSDVNTYWLTWGGAPGLRMGEVPASPDGSPSWGDTVTVRHFLEQDWVWLPLREIHTGWVWTRLNTSYMSYFGFIVDGLGGSGSLDISLVPDGVVACTTQFYLNGSLLADTAWSGSTQRVFHYEGVQLKEGTNTLSIGSDYPSSQGLYFNSMSVSWRHDLDDIGGRDLLFVDPVPGRYTFSAGLAGAGEVRVFDATDHLAPVLLDRIQQTSTGAVFSTEIDHGTRLFAVRPGDMLSPVSIEPAEPGRIAGTLSGADVVVIAGDVLFDAVQPLEAVLEAEGLEVEIVRLGEVYDEFGQGVPDPGAIRSFFRHTQDSWSPVPFETILVGDGHYDNMNRITPEPVTLPAWVDLAYTQGFCSDDLFVIAHEDSDGPETSISRIPADTPQDVTAYLAKLAAYRSGLWTGAWAARVLLVADDEWGATQNETIHTYCCELLADTTVHPSLDRDKFYLIEYPWPAGSHPEKPDAREDLVEELSRGSLAVFFFGHGSHDQICHEKLLVTTDVERIENGMRLPLMVFASCDVGHFYRIAGDCMSEAFVLRPGAGAIVTIGATNGTGGAQNRIFFGGFSSILLDTLPVRCGQALWASKLLYESGPTLYPLFGDGTLVLGMPADRAQLSVEGDALLRGRTNTVTAVLPGDAEVMLTVAESGRWTEYTCLGGSVIRWLRYGGDAFRGTCSAPGGLLEVDFMMPVQSDTGSYGRASAPCLSHQGTVQAWEEWVAVADSGGYSADSSGPVIDLWIDGFEGVGNPSTGPDPVLRARLSDQSGIAFFGGAAGRAILMGLDTQAFDLSDLFSYDPGSSTGGELQFHAPQLLEGPHTAILAAWDGLGNSSRDTLRFSVSPASPVLVTEFLVYPNPCGGQRCFSFTASEDGSAHLSVYTVSGRRIWSTSRSCSAGYCQIPWNGLDSDGDPPASGPYIYRMVYEAPGRSEETTGLLAIVRDG